MVREATLDDRPHFCRMWMELMKSQREYGSYVLPNNHNLRLFVGFFESYVLQTLYGTVLFWQPEDAEVPQAVLMSGETADDGEWETDLGRTSTFWGIHVDPEARGQGIGLKLFHHAMKLGIERDFVKSIDTFVMGPNPHGAAIAEAFGAKVHAYQYIADIEDIWERING